MVMNIRYGSNKDKVWKIIRLKLIKDLKYSIKKVSNREYRLSLDEPIGMMRLTKGEHGINTLSEYLAPNDIKRIVECTLYPTTPDYYGYPNIEDRVYNLSSLLQRGFLWAGTSEGREYWATIYDHLRENDI